MSVERTVCFSSFRLDLVNRQLWGGQERIPLRPKSFAVLRYLVEHAERLVTREELVNAVWADARGAEKAPKRCVLELRVALGDRADHPCFIETVGRFGYRFIAPLVVDGQAFQPQSAVHNPECVTPNLQRVVRALVGRGPELEQLHRWLGKALGGERQIVFVAGEPGIGKTALVETFVGQLRTDDTDGIWIGTGQCIEHYGEGEAYLPVLEALGQLSGAAGNTRLTDILRRYAPSWLLQLPALVSDGELDLLQRRLQGVTRQRMLREIADAISALSAQVPLILVLEDLHWSDYSTLDFLSSVTQHREPARLVLIATYRSTDVAEDHPLRPVAQELLSHGQARELPLAGLTSAAVAAYLDQRFPQHTFSPQLARLLHLRTEGNPLFLINFVEDLIAQELLSQAEGTWGLRVPSETIAVRVPENSRRLIEKQMTRLAPDIQRFLEAGSMAGVEFAAEPVASALSANTEQIEERCDELVRRELFLRRLGVDEWPDGTQTTRYGFRHAVYQQLWSERVPAQRQQRFHLRIGERLEQSYDGRAGELAGELAVHFDKGRDYRRAVHYRYRAAQNALRSSAHREAIDHLVKGLELLEHLPDTPERAQQELMLQIALGVPLTATKGYAAPEVERAYGRALELCARASDTSQIVQALLGLWVFHYVRANLQAAHRLAERCLEQTENIAAADLRLDAHNAAGDTLLWVGDLVPARDHLEQSLALHRARRRGSYVSYDVTDPGVGCLSHLSWALWYLGYPDQAVQRSQEALTLAEQLPHPYSQNYALIFAAALHCFRREPRQTQERAQAAVALANDQGFPLWAAMGTILQSWAVAVQGCGAQALPGLEHGLAACKVIGAELGRTAFLTLLAEAYAATGRAEESLRVLAEALVIADKNGERLYEAEIHRLKGELTVRLGAGNWGPSAGWPTAKCRVPSAVRKDAEGYFLKAIEVARTQQAKSWELRAAICLSRLWQQHQIADARALLSEIYARFTEGFDTADLKQATSLLRELS